MYWRVESFYKNTGVSSLNPTPSDLAYEATAVYCPAAFEKHWGVCSQAVSLVNNGILSSRSADILSKTKYAKVKVPENYVMLLNVNATGPAFTAEPMNA